MVFSESIKLAEKYLSLTKLIVFLLPKVLKIDFKIFKLNISLNESANTRTNMTSTDQIKDLKVRLDALRRYL